ncbi:MAG TPA: thiamine pyrophosphate-binding protein [Gemmatimonadales bacterium]|nr:thiamine pyrophosphate-binding protein [Gemmatimonadales bacterium]
MTSRSGAGHLVAALRENGARCVFGVPGTQTVPIFEALRTSGLRTVLATSEVSAAFMAGGWARVSGEAGVCLTIPGPGFIWSLPGIAEALLDSVPLLVITVAPPDGPGCRFRQQEIAQSAVGGALVKEIVEVSQAHEVAPATRAALAATLRNEPGPVLLQLAGSSLTAESDPADSSTDQAVPPMPDFGELRRRVAAARRPVLFVGQGVRPCSEELRQLAEHLGAPVITTPAGRGTLPEDHPLAMGFDALAGSVGEANAFLAEADLVLVLGAKLGHNGTAGFGLRLAPEHLVHIDASRDVPGANYPASLALVAQVRDALSALLAPPPSRSAWPPDRLSAWRARLRTPAASWLEPRVSGSPERDAPGFFAGLRRALPREAVLVLDSGLHQIMARRHFEVLSPGGLLFPSDLQSMGFGVPSAIGARLSNPSRPIVALVGDGGFAMTGFELLTAVREGVSLVVIVFVDGVLGQIRMHQLRDYGAPHAVDLGRFDLELIANSLGAGYLEADADIEPIVREALSREGVTVIGVPVGDSPRIRRAAGIARLREGFRRAAGPTLIRWIKWILKRGA